MLNGFPRCIEQTLVVGIVFSSNCKNIWVGIQRVELFARRYGF